MRRPIPDSFDQDPCDLEDIELISMFEELDADGDGLVSLFDFAHTWAIALEEERAMGIAA